MLQILISQVVLGLLDIRGVGRIVGISVVLLILVMLIYVVYVGVAMKIWMIVVTVVELCLKEEQLKN